MADNLLQMLLNNLDENGELIETCDNSDYAFSDVLQNANAPSAPYELNCIDGTLKIVAE